MTKSGLQLVWELRKTSRVGLSSLVHLGPSWMHGRRSPGWKPSFLGSNTMDRAWSLEQQQAGRSRARLGL
jgi:hypothetical protein